MRYFEIVSYGLAFLSDASPRCLHRNSHKKWSYSTDGKGNLSKSYHHTTYFTHFTLIRRRRIGPKNNDHTSDRRIVLKVGEGGEGRRDNGSRAAGDRVVISPLEVIEQMRGCSLFLCRAEPICVCVRVCVCMCVCVSVCLPVCVYVSFSVSLSGVSVCVNVRVVVCFSPDQP